LLTQQNNVLKKIASRYSHDLRSPITNMSMLLQLYDKAETNADRQLYVQKISGSVTRMQDGFDELSAERKNSLKSTEKYSPVMLEALVEDIKTQLPGHINIVTNFAQLSQIICQAQNLKRGLEILLLMGGEFKESFYTIEISTEKTWESNLIKLKYPEFLNLSSCESLTTDIKNRLGSMQLLAWKYYFALLFLGAAGANVEIEEHDTHETHIIISFTT